MSKLEGKIVGGNRGRSGGSDSGMSDWEWSDSDGGKERGRKKIRSEVRRVSPKRERGKTGQARTEVKERGT